MSKNKASRKPAGQTQNKTEAPPEAPEDAGRRKFVLIGVSALAAAGVGVAGAYNAGWFDRSSLPSSSNSSQLNGTVGKNLPPIALTADDQNARRAADEMLEHYARDLNNPSALIHAVRGFGKNFKLADGANAVEHLCSRYAADKEVNGKRYVYFKRDAEVHENSFLKTLLEAGVSLDQPITVGANRYTLRDLGESGKALFRCDPQDLFKYDANQFRYDQSYFPPRQTADLRGELLHEHLPWGLVAFSNLIKPVGSSWENADGEKIDLSAVIDRSMAEYEGTCALGEQEMARGEAAPKNFREAIKKYSCFGLHAVYGYLSCLKHGYRGDRTPERVKQMMDTLIYRLKSDAESINQEYTQEGAGAPPQLVEAFRTRALIKLYGHAFESINYARLNQLIAFTPSQERRIQAGERAFYESLVKMRGLDWGMMRKSLGEKFISDIVIALGHAARALKLPTPQNPDVIA